MFGSGDTTSCAAFGRVPIESAHCATVRIDSSTTANYRHQAGRHRSVRLSEGRSGGPSRRPFQARRAQERASLRSSPPGSLRRPTAVEADGARGGAGGRGASRSPLPPAPSEASADTSVGVRAVVPACVARSAGVLSRGRPAPPAIGRPSDHCAGPATAARRPHQLARSWMTALGADGRPGKDALPRATAFGERPARRARLPPRLPLA